MNAAIRHRSAFVGPTDLHVVPIKSSQSGVLAGERADQRARRRAASIAATVACGSATWTIRRA